MVATSASFSVMTRALSYQYSSPLAPSPPGCVCQVSTTSTTRWQPARSPRYWAWRPVESDAISETFTAAFGRLERIAVEERQVFLALVKNPVGFTEVIRTIVPSDDSANLAIFINDRLADGTDVSWLWDVDFELLRGRVNVAVCSGLAPRTWRSDSSTLACRASGSF